MLKKMLFVLLASFIVVFAGCDDDDSNITSPAAETANIRVIHTSYDAPAVDVAVNGNVAISNLGYGVSSGYANVPASTNLELNVSPTGATSPVVINATVTLEGSKNYTVFAVNSLDNIEPVVAMDMNSEVSDKAKIRFIHTAPDAPAVDIKLNDGNGAAIFSNKAFKSVADYIEVDGGTYTLAVTPAGSSTEVVVLNNIPLTNGMVYSVVAHGTLDATDMYPFAVRAFIDSDMGDGYADLDAASSRVKVIHASPDAPSVDLLVDNAVKGNALPYPNNTGYIDLAAGTRNLKVNVAGSATTVINADVPFMVDEYYSVFAVNDVNNIEAVVIKDNLTAPAAGKAHVRFLHFSPDAPAVDITLSDGTIVFSNKKFKEYTDFTPLDAGSYALQVRVAGTETVALDLGTINLQAGKIYSVFAKGFLSGASDKPLGAEIIVNM